MQTQATTVSTYLKELDTEKLMAVSELRKVILKNLPQGFKEEMNYGMIGYVVPHSLYPKGYHCNPALPLSFMNVAAQKNFIAIYHMGIYADATLLQWFVDEYAALGLSKLDMGKSCIRFKKIANIPFELIGKLCTKMTVAQWISLYEMLLNKEKK